MKKHLYELLTHHRASGHQHRWHLCAGSQGYQSRADDTPASVTWLPLVGQWAEVIIQAAGDGNSGLKRDDLTLINVRTPDALPRYASVYDVTAEALTRVELGARPLNVLLTDYVIQRITEKEVDEAAAYGTAVTVWSARAGIPALERTAIRVPLYDRQADFDTPVQTRRYLGTGGYEGPAELKDTLKEDALGWCPMVSPTYLGVIGGLHRWGVSGGQPIEDVPRGWSSAAACIKVTGTPTSGQYVVDLATGYIGTSTKYEDFRVEVKGRKFGGVWKRYPGELTLALAVEAGLVTSGSGAGIDATPRTVGVYLPAGDGRSHRDVYDRLVGSVARGRWYIGIGDDLVVTRLPRAAGATPVRSYRRAGGGTPGLKPLTRTNTPPPKQVILRYAENPNPDSRTADTASAADTALWTQPWREAASVTDAAIVAAYGVGAKVEYVETALALEADAVAELAAWVAERTNPPQPYELKVTDGAPGVWIGDVVRVEDDLAGFEAGAPVVLYGRTNRDRGGGATLYVES
ncbi:hypothetical protein [Azospirillum agricola]|uniref:hypothetical protein n=1 Tax=Azospirillum agricola TaxID=1720247 RepID=UPI000A0F312C|nr:hypothetical protein [Azospirillum agricola]SMH30529.1 hypothetical protein SAMN02982994_0329 [Azospirillum lipoferum]